MKALIIMGAFVCICLTVLIAGSGKKELFAPGFYSVSSGIPVTLGGEQFNMYVARSGTELERGLSGRSGLGKSEGMLFAFDVPGKHGIWMRGMLFPIDVLWLDEQGTIVHMVKDMKPDSYPRSFASPTDSLYVIELPQGTIDRLDLRIGQKAEGSSFGLSL